MSEINRKNNRRPTIKDIAKIAGVSYVTVSSALRDSDLVADKTKEKIKKIAKEMGYTPNLAARNLASNTPTAIGVIVPSLASDTAYNEVLNQLSVLAAKEHLCLLLGSSNRNIEMESAYCKMMCENMVGALIIASCSSDVSHIHDICDNIVPTIFIGGKTSDTEENYILPDTYESGKLAVGYLSSLGHKQIALFLYRPDNNTIQQKLHGYTDAMLEKGLTPQVYWHGDSTDTFNAGLSLTEELIAKNELPTAIWCASDLMAYGVLEALRMHGLIPGEEISVMGHDNLAFSRNPSTALTTISIPWDELANIAMQYAKDLMTFRKNSSLSKPQCKTKLPTSLVVRNTTGRFHDTTPAK